MEQEELLQAGKRFAGTGTALFNADMGFLQPGPESEGLRISDRDLLLHFARNREPL